MATILVVDDSAFQRKLLKDMITSIGHAVKEAVSGKEAIEYIEDQDIDLVCLDLLMPDTTGIEVLEYFQNKNNVPPIIVISADIQITKREQCLALGAAAFINKYIKKEELESSLNQILN